MKNIGVVCYPTFGGSGIVASELGSALSYKYKVHFIAYKKPVRLNTLNKNIFYHKVYVPTYPLFEYPPYELALTTTIVEVVKKEKLDLIHVHYAIPHAYAAVNAQQILLESDIKIPIITTLHGTDITLVGKNPYVASAINYAINHSSLVTAVSESLKADTLTYFNINQDIQVIPNFIEFKSDKIPIRNNQEKIITHISNFRPVKRVLDVIHVFYNIQKKINSRLIMIGDGPDFQIAQELVYSKGLSELVDFVGKTNKIDGILTKTDLFLLPSETESFGLVALEAMSFGVPVITTCSGGIVDLVINQKSGYTCQVGDIKDMSKKAINLIQDLNLYKNMSQEAYNSAKKYDIKNILPLYDCCYKKFIG